MVLDRSHKPLFIAVVPSVGCSLFLRFVIVALGSVERSAVVVLWAFHCFSILRTRR